MRRELLLSVLAAGLGLATLVPCLPAALPAAYAEGAPADLRFFEEQAQKMGKAAAKKLWDVAKDAKAGGFFQFTKEQAERALDFDPDNKDAREYLGWVKKGRTWVLDDAAAAAVKPQNMKNQKEAQASFDKRVENWREKLVKVNEYIASKYAQIGNACGAKGFADQQKKAYERALTLDTNCAAARKGLGHRKVGKLWLDDKQIAAIRQATEGQWVHDPSDLEKGLGVELNKMESPHFRVEDDAGREALPDIIKALETLYVYYLADIGRDPLEDVFEGQKAQLCVMSDKATWVKWVDGFTHFHDKEWLKDSSTYREYKTLAGGILRVETAEHIDTRDPLLHHAAHFMGHKIWGVRNRAWLDEGLAYYYTVRVQNTTRTSCLDKDTTGYGNNSEVVGGNKDWTLSERWREFLRTMVQGKDDVELRTIMLTPLATLELPHSVKAWAVVSWLMDTERDKFLEFLAAIKGDAEADQAAIAQKIFGRSIEQLDKEWRAYALRAF